ncbi:MAG TPA: indole-3-glycerol phosphate synthase TrpC [Pyrinomonadaceae bacterium]|nr:indole-3-glycerol phosphate synthase TrpC [Pyrinomonadaceae bacterium]
MTGTILDKIFSDKRARVEAAKSASDPVALRGLAIETRSARGSHRLREALSDPSRINIIAEFKKASPSKGVINNSVDPAAVARQYDEGGAAAISVLTEEDHFKGSLDDLRAVRAEVDLPILRKDFIFEDFQIYEAAAAGADAILLIAAMLEDDRIERLRTTAEVELGLDALIEVHTLDELERVKKTGATLIGVNNRDLKTFHVTLDVSRKLIRYAPEGAIMVTESGLQTGNELRELSDLGYSGFLIGETLMRTGDPAAELRRLRDSR